MLKTIDISILINLIMKLNKIVVNTKDEDFINFIRDIVNVCQKEFDKNFTGDFDEMRQNLEQLDLQDLKSPKSLKIIKYLLANDIIMDDLIQTTVGFIIDCTEQNANFQIEGIGKLAIEL